MCWFLAGSGYLRGLIWITGKVANLRLLEDLELIFEQRVHGYGLDRGIWKSEGRE